VADIEIITNISGLDELERTLTEGGKRAAKNFLRKVEKTAAKIFQSNAENTAPVDTGFLSDHINVSSRVQGDTLTVQVGPSPKAFYGLFQEFGTEDQPAQHWLNRAFEESKDEALTELINTATEMLNDIAEKK
jgi:HK97 gp10 family phage protein